MSDEDALLAAIEAHPDEDTPRLAYADWCDEHDQPARAEFIRLQCGWRHTADAPTAERRKLQERVRFLIQNRLRDLIGPLGGDLTPLDIRFDRGFLIEGNATARQFVSSPRAFAALRPRPRVNVRNLNQATFDRFVACPGLECVTSIAVNSPGPNTAPVLAGCPLSRLESLDWHVHGVGYGLWDSGLAALAYSDELPRLHRLDASNDDITDAGVARLVESPLWERLRWLDLSHNPITDAGAARLAEASRPGLYVRLDR